MVPASLRNLSDRTTPILKGVLPKFTFNIAPFLRNNHPGKKTRVQFVCRQNELLDSLMDKGDSKQAKKLKMSYANVAVVGATFCSIGTGPYKENKKKNVGGKC